MSIYIHSLHGRLLKLIELLSPTHCSRRRRRRCRRTLILRRFAAGLITIIIRIRIRLRTYRIQSDRKSVLRYRNFLAFA